MQNLIIVGVLSLVSGCTSPVQRSSFHPVISKNPLIQNISQQNAPLDSSMFDQRTRKSARPAAQLPAQVQQKPASKSAKVAPQKPEDDRCASLTKYARSMVALRDSGISREILAKIKSDDGFPGPEIQRDVFTRKDMTADEHSQRIADLCKETGYDNIRKRLNQEEENRMRH